MREEERQRHETHTNKLEGFVKDLQKENKKHEEEVEKALKIHRANEFLSQKNEEFKG